MNPVRAFHCFVLDDKESFRDYVVRTLEPVTTKSGVTVRAYGDPQQLAEDIDRLQEPSKPALPVFAVVDGDMSNANYEDTSCVRPRGDLYEPDITGALQVLRDKREEGKIGPYIVALHSASVVRGGHYGVGTPPEKITSENFQPNPESDEDVIKIEKSCTLASESLIERAFEFAKQIFGLTTTTQP